ncbi:cytochrome c oxidase subunit IV-domain-containing protein [Dichomitus squalens]|uniref:Cytochrome c oxidase subunit IV-domain-containing protein n=1 Tax=Dichomitus squalens TaxID=114155 RepID=A0A4Q9QC86_9APHY|nr:cytochrome c oxidase subunit IV [Dichomitus squalens LYAD-421 SS1]EJF66239.1 cytochrome c oxidase subunit IV [Dichomitus squalens LYAD-421 SS1]TBU50246.1 cytochrome c oxidase subunit IV-domain-containing protein [Dichomitus squalens]TBU65372.1 cytochrome c oxidase subunit IV-domain-containing protein [Dichomitus squalens]
MQALRLARPRLPLRPASRAFAAAASSVHGGAPAASSSASPVIPLSNVEAMWERLSADEQLVIHQQLEELQKKDWKSLSIDEKKAAYYVAFGPHGPRAPTNPPGTVPKVILGVTGLVVTATVLFYSIRATAPPPPKTLSKEWEEASNERALEQKINPIHGISSEGYSGPGFVTHK